MTGTDVTRLRTPRWIAWLAMMAIGLAIVAPVISQTLATDAMLSMSMSMDCDEHGDHAMPSAPHAASMEKCGYCGLLAHHITLPGTIAAVQTFPLPASVPLPAGIRDSAEPSDLAAAPRGPPVSSQG